MFGALSNVFSCSVLCPLLPKLGKLHKGMVIDMSIIFQGFFAVKVLSGITLGGGGVVVFAIKV